MKILVVGSGGREHAMVRALMSAQPQPQVWVAPGNPGTAEWATNLAVAAHDVAGLVAAARALEVELVIPGPEAPLVAGLADALKAAGIACCGPSAAAAQLEGSKTFTRTLAAAHRVPSPHFVVVESVAALRQALAAWRDAAPPVVKADGLAAGKGVFLPETLAKCAAVGERLLGGALGAAGQTVVLEERLFGVEASLFFACNGTQAVALPHARDHKRWGDGDTGPNTGGMGAVSPNPSIDATLLAEVERTMVAPTLRALVERGTPFCGFLFVGIMCTARGPLLLEFNVRLGDPEAEAILPRLAAGEFLRLCEATARGPAALEHFRLALDPRPTCAVVLTAAGYPETPRQGDAIELGDVSPARASDAPHTGAANNAGAATWIDHAGTARQAQTLVTRGGRVAVVVAQAADAAAARLHAYARLDQVRFAGMHYRRDIGLIATPPAPLNATNRLNEQPAATPSVE